MKQEPIHRDNLRGAAMMSASMAGFVLNDAIMKILVQGMPFYQALLLRGVVVGVMIVGLAYATGGLDLRLSPRDRWIVFWRTIAEIAATYLIVTALIHMPLANVTTILQSLPLTVALAGALFFKEPLGWRRLVAIIVGFCGVLIIVRPGAEFNFYTIYALGAVGAVTVRDLASRQLSPSVKVLPVALFATFGTAGLGLALFVFGGGAAEPWQAVTGPQVWLILGGAACLIVGYNFSVSAMRVGMLAVVTPFRYTAILFALILGLVVFNDWPDTLTLIGAGIIVFSGLVTLYREQLIAKRARAGS